MVNWMKLGDVCEIVRGVRLIRKELEKEGNIPVFQNSLTPLGFYSESNNPGHTTFIICAGAAGEIGYSNIPFWAADDCLCLTCPDSLHNKYAYYYLLVSQSSLKSKVRKASVPRLSRIEVDTFTDSIENLKQQIDQRRKQYEHYRDQLLDLEGKEGVEMKTIGKIGKCYAGATPSTKINTYWENGTIPWMSSGEVHHKVVTKTSLSITQEGYKNSSTKMLPVNTVVIALAGQGKTRGSVAITAIELCTNQSLCGIVIETKDIINKYVYYYLRTQYNELRRISSGEGTRGGLNLKMIGSYPVPIPPLSEQQRIVSILDTFEASISNLEAQLEQRQKQYEYYRNKLLSFEKEEQ